MLLNRYNYNYICAIIKEKTLSDIYSLAYGEHCNVYHHMAVVHTQYVIALYPCVMIKSLRSSFPTM